RRQEAVKQLLRPQLLQLRPGLEPIAFGIMAVVRRDRRTEVSGHAPTLATDPTTLNCIFCASSAADRDSANAAGHSRRRCGGLRDLLSTLLTSAALEFVEVPVEEAARGGVAGVVVARGQLVRVRAQVVELPISLGVADVEVAGGADRLVGRRDDLPPFSFGSGLTLDHAAPS